MEAQITAGMKTPVLSSRAGPEGSAGDKGRKRESEALNTERNEQVCCACCAGGKNHFVLSPSRERNCQFFEFVIYIIESRGWGSFYSLLGDFTQPTSPLKKPQRLGTCLAILTRALLFLILLVPLWPPHTGPIGGPCPRTGLARKPVWVWRSPAVPGAWPGWDQPHCVCAETPGVLADCIFAPCWWTLPQAHWCVHVNLQFLFFILHLEFSIFILCILVPKLHLCQYSVIDRAYK